MEKQTEGIGSESVYIGAEGDTGSINSSCEYDIYVESDEIS